MDELDSKIIDLLQENGRSSNAKIARDVGVSEGTVRRRLKRLVQDEVIHVVAMADPQKMGYGSEALIGIQTDPDKVDQVAETLSHLAQVRWVAITTGSYDIFVWGTLPTAEELGIFLRTKIGTIPGVRRTETFVTLSIHKRSFGLAI